MSGSRGARLGPAFGVVTALVVAALPLLTWPAQSATTSTVAVGDQSWFVFTRDPSGGAGAESGDEEIYASRVDGSEVRRLTTNSCVDITATVSHDGRWLAWVQKCAKDVDILLAPISYDATGRLAVGPPTNVTAALGRSAERWPQFSPDDTELAFIRKTTGNFDIYRATLGGTASTPALTGSTRVVRLGGSDVEDCCVTWSPDGSKLVWASNVNKGPQSFNLYQVSSRAAEVWDATSNLDGSRDGTLDVAVVTQLTSGSEYEGTPSYDAEGRVLFRCNCPNPDVYRLDPATGARQRLTTWTGLDRTPEGFPGGILYSRANQTGSDEVYSAAADGSGAKNLTNHAASDLDPTWVWPQ